MLLPRIIPTILLKGRGLVKTINFENPRYVGDPINIVKIFNDKESDELFIFDIEASRNNGIIQYNLLEKIANNAFMPLGYGGGIKNIDEIKDLFYMGFEKVSLNHYALVNPELIKEAASKFGSQSIIVTIDVKRNESRNYIVYDYLNKQMTNIDAVEMAVKMEKLGAGEIIINSVDRDGTMTGYEISLIRKISSHVNIPIIALGGAGKIIDLINVVKKGGASAAAVGSFFIFYGTNRAVLISYPNCGELMKLFEGEINGKL